MHDRETRTVQRSTATAADAASMGTASPGKRALTDGLAMGAAAQPVQMLERPDRGERERPEQQRPERQEAGAFGQPYASWTEAAAAEAYLRATLIPSATGMFGAEVGGLWASFLSRSPGDSLSPRVYRDDTSGIAYAFKHCAQILDAQNTLLDEVIANIARAPTLTANQWTTVPLSTFIGTTPRTLSINFSNPYDTPGHIAGGLSGSDAGPDTRSVEGNVRLFRVTDETGATTEIKVEPDFRFRVFDAIDFIPGGAGTGIEQIFTIPLSRLEASGWAYDVPFEVLFTGPVSQRAVTGGALPAPNPDDATRQERQRTPGEPRERETSRPRLGEREDTRRRDL
jgi:hypothetical protein